MDLSCVCRPKKHLVRFLHFLVLWSIEIFGVFLVFPATLLRYLRVDMLCDAQEKEISRTRKEKFLAQEKENFLAQEKEIFSLKKGNIKSLYCV
jgi:hypothetical protein